MKNFRKKTVMTITGIRPDFIRMYSIFKLLDKNFNHILVHTGQHYSNKLSKIFFKELKIRKPDYNLYIGSKRNEHYHQSAKLSISIIELIRSKKINPDLIIFLGDSNSVTASIPLKKEGYKIGHIEAGMRSGDKRMLEEINRTVCDHCSDYLFVYHNDYKKNLLFENINKKNIYVVGNTIIEPIKLFFEMKKAKNKKYNKILVDIHRPENFKYKERLKKIIKLCKDLSKRFNLEIYFLSFGRTIDYLKKFKINTKNIKFIDMLSYKNFLYEQYNSLCIISDSGTAQEEAPLLKTPVITPRDYTERPQSMKYNCSFLFDLNNYEINLKESINYIEKINAKPNIINVKWLGSGQTSNKIIKILKDNL